MRQRLQRITYGVCCVLIFGSVLLVYGSLHVGEMETDGAYEMKKGGGVVVEADEGFFWSVCFLGLFFRGRVSLEAV